MQEQIIRAAGKNRVLNVKPDAPDIRDRYYEPALIPLAPQLDFSNPQLVLDQGQEGACTGFGAAAAINLLKYLQSDSDELQIVSARMIYEMAKKHDEWPGEDYEGSSCRGAIKGWKNMGVCGDELWPYDTRDPGALNIERAKDARSTILGAYYRLRPNLNDYHAALNEAGALYVSAKVHDGWNKPRSDDAHDFDIIDESPNLTGGHAFAIVGYTEAGFIVQNSWGSGWGSDGFAIWSYEDWALNVSDGWVFRLAVSTPNVFGLTAKTDVTDRSQAGKTAPKRIDIAGHFAHFDDGVLKEKGDYWSTLYDIQLTVDRVKEMAAAGTIQHLLFYAHGGLNNPKASANRIKALKDGFKRNGIYPFHFMYDTGLGEELGDILRKAFLRSEGLFDGWKDRITDASDKLIEGVARGPGTAMWEEMKRGASKPFEQSTSDGIKVMELFLNGLADTDVKIHLVGHSTGAILLGNMLTGVDKQLSVDIQSCSLLAPACTIEFYRQNYVPLLPAKAKSSKIQVMDLYNLNDKLERDDNVARIYRKSLLYLVSRAFERSGRKPKPLLGIDKYSKSLKTRGLIKIVSTGKGAKTESTSHGGFDNDKSTMNHVLKRVLKGSAKYPFSKKELEY